MNLIPDEDLEATGIDDAYGKSNNAHEHQEWPVHPGPQQEGMEEKALIEIKGLLKGGTLLLDGLKPEERDKMAALVAGRLPANWTATLGDSQRTRPKRAHKEDMENHPDGRSRIQPGWTQCGSPAALLQTREQGPHAGHSCTQPGPRQRPHSSPLQGSPPPFLQAVPSFMTCSSPILPAC